MEKNPFDKILRVFMFVFFLIYPLAIDPFGEGYTHLKIVKGVVLFSTITIMLPLPFLFGDDRGRRSITTIYKNKSGQVFCGAALLFIVSLFISMASSINPLMTLTAPRGPVLHLVYIILFFFVSIYGGWSWSYCTDFSLAIIINSLIMTSQVSGKNTLNLYPNNWTIYDSVSSYSGEYMGTLGNTNVLSVWLVVAIAMSLGGVLCSEKRWQRIINFAGCGIGCYIAILGQTEILKIAWGVTLVIVAFFLVTSKKDLVYWISSALLSSGGVACGYGAYAAAKVTGKALMFFAAGAALCVLGIGIFAFCEAKKAWISDNVGNANFKWKCWWMIIIVCIATGAILFVYFNPKNILSSGALWQLHEILNGRAEDRYGSHRVLIWKRTVQTFLERPLFGWGEPFHDVTGVGFSKFYPATGGFTIRYVGHAHNLLLTWLHHNGIAGTGLSAVMTGIVICKTIKSNNKSAMVSAAAAAAYLFTSLTCVGGLLTDFLFWVMLGLSMNQAIKKEGLE